MTPNSRSYLNRWISPDTDVPESQGIQAFDRYAYVNNSPVVFVDPTGHYTCNPKDCGYTHDFDSAPREMTPEEQIVFAEYTLEARFNIAMRERGEVEQMLVGHVEPFHRATALAWAVDRAISFSGADSQLALIDISIISASNLTTGLMAMSMGGDLTPVVGSGNAYSVAYETTLPQSAYRYTRPGQNYIANKALLADMNTDPQFAQAMNEIIPNLSRDLYYRPSASPKGWTWHHVADQPGVMQLIPRIQHEFSFLQYLLHPGGQGGFSLWH